jgi:hypothetical protein
MRTNRLLKAWVPICVTLFAVALLSGCGTTGAENAGLAGRPLKTSHARLRIQRSDELMAAGPAARVKLDGREIANLGVGGSTMLDVPAGARKIAVDQEGHPRTYSITLHAKPGMLYTLEISPRGEAVMAGAVFGLVGTLVEAAVNENGGTFQIRVVDAKPARG